MELGGKLIPQSLEPFLIQVRDRVRELEQRYGSLSKWGRPVFFDLKEIAVIFYLNEKFNVSLDRLATFLTLDKTALYKLVKNIREKNKATYFDPKENTTKIVSVKPEELINMVEELLNVASRQKITDPFQSSIIKSFWENKVQKRAKIAGKPAYLTEEQKKATISVVQRVMEYLAKNKPEAPTNPDYWSEDLVEEALWNIYKTYERVANAMILLRRVPQWANWFKGKIGAVTKRINPRLSVLFYKDYLRIKELYKQGKITEGEFLVVWLHITTGAREGYSLYDPKTPLDDPNVNSSLIGLRWENLQRLGDVYILKIYESKTNKWWTCDLSWLDPEMVPTFMKYAREKGNIIKDLLGVSNVHQFYMKYRSLLKRISQLLELPFTLKPHDMRRSHISILAELGVPMEYAVSGYMDFGVGWEDLKTAVVFYLRFSRYTKEILKKQIEERKRIILSS